MRWRLTKAQGHDTASLAIEPAGRAGDPPVTRTIDIGRLTAAEWEGNALATLGLRADLGAPLIGEAIPGKPGARAGLEAGDRIVAINDMPVRSPGDVAAITNARPGVPTVFTVERGGATRELTVTPEAQDQGGRKVGIAGIKLTIDPAPRGSSFLPSS